MRAAVLAEYGEPLEVRELDRPTPAAHGAVVEVEACGVCRSDWHAWQGHGEWADDQVPRGQVLGHEPAGRIAAVGERVTDLSPGDRVCVPFNLGDGSCHACRNGHGNVCSDGYALGFEPDAPGAFAEYVHVPHAEYNAARLPESVSFAAAAALGCRYATAFHGLAHRAELGAGEWVVVVGCGGVGLSAVQLADALGARPVAVDVSEDALDRAADLDAEVTVNADGEGDVPGAVEAATGGGAHVSVDALGSADTCRTAVASLRPRGRPLQLGLTGEEERGEIPLPTDVMTRWEVSYFGSRGMPPSRYDELLGLVDGGGADPEALVTRELSLAAVPDRLAAMSEFDTRGIEVVTEFSGSQ